MKLDIRINKTKNPKIKPIDENNLGFGNYFSDHMFIMEYEDGIGWKDARIEPYHPLTLDPASMVFHYGQEIFEGMKAYATKENDVNLFRPYDNAKRLNQSAERMCMPNIDENFFVESLCKLVDLERDWIPKSEGTSLVLRPTMIAVDPFLGVRASKNYIYFIICSPSGAYFKEGISPTNIYVEEKYVRSVAGGVGYAKTGGNYAASLKAANEAASKGYSQVLWLDALEHKYVEEVGAMNMMFVIDNVIITSPIDGTILPGITRDSIIKLAVDKGYKVEERKLSIDEIVAASNNGKLNEAFGTGTAAVVSPVGKLNYKGNDIIINNGETGPISSDLYDTLIGIQRGYIDDKYGWITVVRSEA